MISSNPSFISTAITSTLDFMISLTSISPNLTIPFSIFFSSSGVVSSDVISIASERSLIEMSTPLPAICLSIKEVDLTRIKLNGEKNLTSAFNGITIIVANFTALVAAYIFGMISPNNKIKAVTTTIWIRNAIRGYWIW